ncbi:ABC transporter ATP-binding protein [Treponema denticola]|jgi:ABC transporter related|uniref:ABC transporter ATP-binding protein n=1 Tax=Treponema denticola TaxID=158 RepID=UPI0020A46495|nr:ABC transporter ATP-binding protein [Treponema denticola]UTC85129.1 ABC transporter ATP-binding protein [Treponema denticola]
MQKLKTFWKAFRFIFLAMPSRTFVLLILTILEGAVPALLALIMKYLVDTVIGGNTDSSLFFYLIISWLFVMVINQGISALLRLTIDIYNVKVSCQIGELIIKKRLSIAGTSVFEDPEFQKIYERISDTQYRIENFVNNFRYWCKSIIEFVSIFVLFLSFEIWIPLAIFISILPGIFAAKKIAKLQLEEEESIYDIERKTGYYRNVLVSPQAAREIRLFDFGNLFFNKFKTSSKDLIKKNSGFRKHIAALDFTGTGIRIIAVALIMLILSKKAANGSLSAGSLAMFLQSVFAFSSAMLTIIEFWAYQDSAIAFFDRLFDFLNIEDRLYICKNPRPFYGLIKSVEFKNVSFSYDGKRDILKNISFKINEKEITALVGENGAGKTTLIKLLARFYDPNSGEILVNGINIKELDIDEYQKAISAVFQDYMKYYISAEENISAGKSKNLNLNKAEGLKEDKLKVDLKFIFNLPEKEKTIVGTYFGGTEISGGQWQRLAIARGLNKEHSLLLVDEPTASIDPIQEREIYKSILTKKEMTLLVTHRLGSIRMADRIFVLREGKLIAEGNHEKLMDSCKYYNKLYSSQADMYI